MSLVCVCVCVEVRSPQFSFSLSLFPTLSLSLSFYYLFHPQVVINVILMVIEFLFFFNFFSLSLSLKFISFRLFCGSFIYLFLSFVVLLDVCLLVFCFLILIIFFKISGTLLGCIRSQRVRGSEAPIPRHYPLVVQRYLATFIDFHRRVYYRVIPVLVLTVIIHYHPIRPLSPLDPNKN